MKVRAEDNPNFEEYCIDKEIKYVSVLSITDEIINKIDKFEKMILRQIKKKNWIRRRWR